MPSGNGLLDIVHRRPAAVAAALILLYTALAWSQRFILDDAFISFRYAANLAQGHGLVWNTGEAPIEGFTNFLWVLIMTVPHLAGIDPVAFSMILGVLAFAAALAVQFRIAAVVTGQPWAGTAAVLVLGGLYSFRAFATGGMETMFQTFLVIAVFLLVAGMTAVDEVSNRKLALVSILSGAAFLTRMDSALLVAVPMIRAAAPVVRLEPPGKRIKSLAALCGPVLLISGALVAWKISYFGTVLPNTFNVKVPSGMISPAGLVYVHNFLLSYLLYPLIPLIPAALIIKRKTAPSAVRAMTLILLLWLVYLIRVGGDFMEYRFMVPVMPFLVVLLLWSAWSLTGSVSLRGALIILLLAGSINHQATHRSTADNSLTESIGQLSGHLMDYGDAWITTGVMLGEYLGNARGEPVTIALTPAGAIPYYSKLRTIDMLGLNDRGVAENGLHAPQNAAGHQLVAPISYLRDRGVNLLLGHPATYDTAADPRVYLEKAISRAAFMSEANVRQLAPVVRIVEIPVLKNRKIVAVYLNDHEHIDRLITTGIFRSYQVEIMEDTRNSHTRKTFHKTAAVAASE